MFLQCKAASGLLQGSICNNNSDDDIFDNSWKVEKPIVNQSLRSAILEIVLHGFSPELYPVTECTSSPRKSFESKGGEG